MLANVTQNDIIKCKVFSVIWTKVHIYINKILFQVLTKNIFYQKVDRFFFLGMVGGGLW